MGAGQGDRRALAGPCARRPRSSAAAAPCTYCSPGTCSAGGSTASTVPRSTCTIRGSLLCCTTPATMSPSRPRNSPSTCSSSASRSRCRITCRAVVAAIRPKPLRGVVPLPGTLPSVVELLRPRRSTCPVLPVELDAGVRLRRPRCGGRRAAAPARSPGPAGRTEISFSRSSARRAAMSMSISYPPPPSLVRASSSRRRPSARPAGRTPPAPARGPARVPAAPAARRRRPARRRSSSTRDQPALRLGPVRRHGAVDQPAARAQPVPPLGQRPVDARGADLQHVRRAPSTVGGVEGVRRRPGDTSATASRPPTAASSAGRRPRGPRLRRPARLTTTSSTTRPERAADRRPPPLGPARSTGLAVMAALLDVVVVAGQRPISRWSGSVTD